MLILEEIWGTFQDTLLGHAALAVYLFVIMDERRWERLKKLPALLLSPATVTCMFTLMYLTSTLSSFFFYFLSMGAILLMCTLWVKWAWRIGFWRAFAAACMAGVFQVSASCMSRMLLQELLLPYFVTLVIFWTVIIVTAAILYKLRFGAWFRLLLEESPGQRRTALLLFGLETAMEAILLLQNGMEPRLLALYCLVVVVTVALIAGLVISLAQRIDDVRRLEAQQNVIAQQQLYERDLEAVRREVRSFRHDYKNLLAGLSEQAGEGELDALRAALSELDAGFDRRIGEKIQASVQIGNLRVPQVRSLLLSKLAAMGERGIDCRLEVLYPVERVYMDVWDFVRCLGVLIDNAAEAALETEAPWVEVVLLAQEKELSLRVSNPYAGTIDPDKLWAEGGSTKGAGRGLGLSGYQRILAEYPNAVSSTSWAEGVFVQELSMGGRR